MKKIIILSILCAVTLSAFSQTIFDKKENTPNHNKKSNLETKKKVDTPVGFTDDYFENSKNLDIFTTLYKELNTFYVDETDPGKLMKEGIDKMLKSLDPYTAYIPESEIEDFRFMTTGQYGGIGAIITKRADYVYVSEPYEGYPAQKAGLMAGDKIL